MKIWQSRSLTAVLIFLLALFSIHIASELLEGARVDLTSDELYSLSDGTERLIEKMQEEGVKPVDITLYFSLTTGKTLPKFIKDFLTYERYLRSLLGEYERASKGKIRLRFVDPVPDSDEGQDAADYGLDGKLINQHGDLFYFGLVFQTQTGSKDTMPFLWPSEQESVEYEISRTLHGLLWPSSKRVGILSSLEVMGGASDPFMAQMLAAQGRRPSEKWIILQLLEDLYDVSAIPADTEEISRDDYDLVVAIHPKDLSSKARWALDKWVVTGGNALIFLDPYSIDDRPPQNPQQPWAALQYRPASDLGELLDAWGVSLEPDAFAADFELAVTRPVTMQGAAERVLVDLLIDGEEHRETLAEGQPVLQGLRDLRFLLAGSLKQAEEVKEGVEIVPFITTTEAGSTLTIEPGFGSDNLAYSDLNNAAKMRDRFTPGTEPVVLSYLIRGKLDSAYPEGIDYPSEEPERPPGLPPGVELPPPEDAEMIHQDPVPEDERGEATVLVFADVDFISNQLAFIQNPLGIIQAANDNHKVVLNAVDFLIGADELMEVRSKGRLDRPFTLFDEIEADAEQDSLDRESALRADVEKWEQELREKQSEITQRNAALFQKRLQEETARLNEKVREANRELREIRKTRRAALERQEAMVRFSVLGWMPVLILGAGIFLAGRRRQRDGEAKDDSPGATKVIAEASGSGAAEPSPEVDSENRAATRSDEEDDHA